MYPSKTFEASEAVKLIEKHITRFRSPQPKVRDNGTAFLSNDFVNWTHKFGITVKPQISCTPWTEGKVEVQNKNAAKNLGNIINNTSSNWAGRTTRLVFALNTAV